MVDAVLNRASLSPLYNSVEQAAVDVEQMLRGLACLEEGPVLRTHVDPWLIPVSAVNGVTLSLGDVAHRFYDDAKTYDVAAFFDDLQRMTPSDADFGDDLINSVLACQIGTPAQGLEETFPSVVAADIDAIQCALTNSVLVSLCQDDKWRYARMGFVDPQLPGMLAFDHIGHAVHGLAVAERRREFARDQLTSRNFWERKEECFPHLRFGIDVEGQIRVFAPHLLDLAFTRLGELDRFSQLSIPGSLPPSGEQKKLHGIKPETHQTMRRHGTDRNFHGADGEVRTFEDHVRVDGLYRIHLFIHEDEPIVEIGYMGRHLPTMGDPT